FFAWTTPKRQIIEGTSFYSIFRDSTIFKNLFFNFSILLALRTFHENHPNPIEFQPEPAKSGTTSHTSPFIWTIVT
ncbi:MAG: hypothetical protein OXC82_05235, partial [Rhodobacteraceae bacterium]|nr:hypothetical protein [Paracoccaceae bacterium]